jgi:hypothetical protein
MSDIAVLGATIGLIAFALSYNLQVWRLRKRKALTGDVRSRLSVVKAGLVQLLERTDRHGALTDGQQKMLELALRNVSQLEDLLLSEAPPLDSQLRAPAGAAVPRSS